MGIGSFCRPATWFEKFMGFIIFICCVIGAITIIQQLILLVIYTVNHLHWI
jgi:hypothetical protein